MERMDASRTQIVATIGPKSGTADMLHALIDHHMDVVRLNMSWGTYDEHASYIDRTRQVAGERGLRIPIILDVSGPRKQGESGHAYNPDAQTVDGVLSEKDLRDIDFGLQHGVEYVCMSYVADASDINHVRALLGHKNAPARVMAKIERKVAVENARSIIDASDAVMIGRGDLGLDIPIETMPFIQKNLIDACKAGGKPVITATQMLYSMISSPAPTRAEVTDVAYAVLCGSDAVMLSEETARGEYPLEAVTVMERIVLEAEKHLSPRITLL